MSNVERRILNFEVRYLAFYTPQLPHIPRQFFFFHFTQQRPVGVFFRKDRRFDGPVDADLGVVPEDAMLGLGVVEVGALIGKQGPLAEDAKAMGETFGDAELFPVFRGEPDSGPLAEGGGTGPDIDGDIEYFT